MGRKLCVFLSFMKLLSVTFLILRGTERDIIIKAKCSASVQTGPGAHPASYTMGTGSFSGVKRPWRGVDHPPLTSAEAEGRVELHVYSLSGHSWPVLERTLPFTTYVFM